ncbi:MAG TPA: hypothetical protein VHU41_06075, partial [Thermoanaerobaculia bacterium]|nr:hypothetical protein [Thermoanaerobaculia bacterium]
TCPSSRTAMRDSCFVALITISRDIDFAVYPERSEGSSEHSRDLRLGRDKCGGSADPALRAG